METSIQVEIPAVKAYPDIDSYEMRLAGSASLGTRTAVFSINLVDEKNNFLKNITKVLTPEEYDAFWPNFTSDKQAISAIFPDVDVSSVPDSITNIPKIGA